MKIIEPSATLLRPGFKYEGVEALRFIERMGRISHRSEVLQTQDSWSRFIQSVVLDRGDWSICEHAGATVEFRVNRGITHEQVRHRLFSPTQESTRFVNYGKETGPLARTAEYIPSIEVVKEDLSEWCDDFGVANDTYLKWLKRGYAPEIARDHLPHGLAATIAITGNLRNWRHAFLMRTTKETHPDLRRVMIPLLTDFQERIPLLFDDIVPMSRQIENLEKAA